MSDTIAKLRDLLLNSSKAGRLRGLLDSIYGAASTGAEAYGAASSPMSAEHSGMLGGLLMDFSPLGDAKSAYDGINAARQGDYLGAALGGLGALPMVPNLAGMAKPISQVNIFGRELVPAALQAEARLSPQAKKFSENWNLNWDRGQDAFMQSREALELDRAFDLVREKMRIIYGDKVPLFRGEAHSPFQPDRKLFSWTPDEELARKFATNSRVIPKPVSSSTIDSYIKQFEKTGKVQMGGNTYLRNKSDPNYYDIYSGNQHLTDGDNFIEEALQFKADRDEWIDRLNSKGTVYQRNIPIDDTFWIPTGLNLSNPEIITKFNPRTR